MMLEKVPGQSSASVEMESEESRLALFRPIGNEPRRGVPLYRAVEDHIRGLISSGKFIPGDLIPSERQLAQVLNVSPGTIKKAIDNLTWEGLLYRHQGKGTYVSKVDFEQSMFRFFSYGDAEGRPVRIHKETTNRRVERGRAEICRRLHVATGTRLLYIERIGYIEDKPILVEYSWWSTEAVPGLEDESIRVPDYLYALVLDQFGVPVIRADETLTADVADEKTAAMINVDLGAPVIVLRRVAYTRGDKVVEVRTTKGRADRFSYKTEIR